MTITDRFKAALCLFLFLLPIFTDGSQAFERAMATIETENPFDHNLNVQYSRGTSQNILLCSHEFGGNSQTIINRARANTSDTLIAFNYIDYDFSHAKGDDTKTKMATPIEVMPLLYMLKKCVVDSNISTISLYGYSLGAANIIYALEYLTTNDHSELLRKYSITASDKVRILEALRKGKILLEVPFKSIDEMIALQGPTQTLLMYKARAAKFNVASPLDTLKKLKNLKVTVLVFFNINDEVFSNRYDSQFIKNLMEANSNGINIVIANDDGSHSATHAMLWKVYSSL